MESAAQAMLRKPGSGRAGRSVASPTAGSARALGCVGSLAPAAPARRPHADLRRRRARSMVPAALPLFDVSVAVLASLDDLNAGALRTFGGDAVMESALHVPTAHVLACQVDAYGSPFAAPELQSLQQGPLTGQDLEFASCLAAPPDRDEAAGGLTVRERLMRMLSLARVQNAPSLAARASAAAGLRGADSGGLVERTASERKVRSGGGPSRTRSDDADGDALGAAAEACSSGSLSASHLHAHMQQQQQHEASGAAAAAAVTNEEAYAPDADGDAVAPLPRLAPAAAAAVAAAAAAAAASPEGPTPAQGGAAAALLAGCHDVVGALVGVGALLVRGFDARAAPARGLEADAAALAGRMQRLLSVRSLVPAASGDAAGLRGFSFLRSAAQPPQQQGPAAPSRLRDGSS